MPISITSWSVPNNHCCIDVTYDLFSEYYPSELEYEFTLNKLPHTYFDTIHVTLGEANLCTPGTFNFYLRVCVIESTKCNYWTNRLYSLEVMYDPNDSSTIYLETGDASNEEIEAISDLGIYKSEYNFPVLNIIKNFVEF